MPLVVLVSSVLYALFTHCLCRLLWPTVVRVRSELAEGVVQADTEIPLLAPLRAPAVRDRPIPVIEIKEMKETKKMR